MTNIIKHYFPIYRYGDKHYNILEHNFGKVNFNKYLSSNIKFSYDALTFMSKRLDAEIITSIIIYHIKSLKLCHENLIITDATSGIGGNTLSFAYFFKKVNAIESDVDTFKMLKKNIDTYKFTNINIFNYDYVEYFKEIKQNIVFIDPPWGGKNYKKHESITLFLSGIRIEKICRILLKLNNIIVLKLPINYDITYIYGILHANNTKIFIHTLNKMLIFVIYKIIL